MRENIFRVISDLEGLALLERSIVGTSENNVKIKMVIPLLQILGHKIYDLDFEYGYELDAKKERIDIFIRNLLYDNRVIIETKSFGTSMGRDEEKQLANYAKHVNALLAFLMNGDEIKSYVYTGKKLEPLGPPIKWREMNNIENRKLLTNFLSRENLTSGKVRNFLQQRHFQNRITSSELLPLKIHTNVDGKKGAIHEATGRYCIIEKIDEETYRYCFEDSDEEIGDFKGWSFDDLIVKTKVLEKTTDTIKIELTIEKCKCKYANDLWFNGIKVLEKIGANRENHKNEKRVVSLEIK